jgi:hypothetical protein
MPSRVDVDQFWNNRLIRIQSSNKVDGVTKSSHSGSELHSSDTGSHKNDFPIFRSLSFTASGYTRTTASETHASSSLSFPLRSSQTQSHSLDDGTLRERLYKIKQENSASFSDRWPQTQSNSYDDELASLNKDVQNTFRERLERIRQRRLKRQKRRETQQKLQSDRQLQCDSDFSPPCLKTISYNDEGGVQMVDLNITCSTAELSQDTEDHEYHPLKADGSSYLELDIGALQIEKVEVDSKRKKLKSNTTTDDNISQASGSHSSQHHGTTEGVTPTLFSFKPDPARCANEMIRRNTWAVGADMTVPLDEFNEKSLGLKTTRLESGLQEFKHKYNAMTGNSSCFGLPNAKPRMSDSLDVPDLDSVVEIVSGNEKTDVSTPLEPEVQSNRNVTDRLSRIPSIPIGINAKGLERPQRSVFHSLSCHARGGNRVGNLPRLSTAKASSALLPSRQSHDIPYREDVDGLMKPKQTIRLPLSPPRSSSNTDRDLRIIGVSRTPQQPWDVGDEAATEKTSTCEETPKKSCILLLPPNTIRRDRNQWYRRPSDSMVPTNHQSLKTMDMVYFVSDEHVPMSETVVL